MEIAFGFALQALEILTVILFSVSPTEVLLTFLLIIVAEIPNLIEV